MRSVIVEQAAEWFVANRAGLGPKERQAFSTWLKSSHRHVEEYLALAVMARDLREACRDSARSLDSVLSRARLETQGQVVPLHPSRGAAVAEMGPSRWRPLLAAAFVCVVPGMLVGGTSELPREGPLCERIRSWLLRAGMASSRSTGWRMARSST
ncbi:MAG: FecR/PupR family sigma factor regulator [Pseudorhodoferax sp.]